MNVQQQARNQIAVDLRQSPLGKARPYVCLQSTKPAISILHLAPVTLHELVHDRGEGRDRTRFTPGGDRVNSVSYQATRLKCSFARHRKRNIGIGTEPHASPAPVQKEPQDPGLGDAAHLDAETAAIEILAFGQ